MFFPANPPFVFKINLFGGLINGFAAVCQDMHNRPPNSEGKLSDPKMLNAGEESPAGNSRRKSGDCADIINRMDVYGC
jgi:hypothetical protein